MIFYLEEFWQKYTHIFLQIFYLHPEFHLIPEAACMLRGCISYDSARKTLWFPLYKTY